MPAAASSACIQRLVTSAWSARDRHLRNQGSAAATGTCDCSTRSVGNPSREACLRALRPTRPGEVTWTRSGPKPASAARTCGPIRIPVSGEAIRATRAPR